MSNQPTQSLPVNFTTLALSFGYSAVFAMGLEAHPQTGQVEKNLDVAQFNIDMLALLKEKTKNNLTPDERKFLDDLIGDLQMKFVYANQTGGKENKA